MLSLPLPPTFQGESLVPLMKGTEKKATADLPAYAETDYPIGHSAERAAFSPHGKISFVPLPARTLRPVSGQKRCAQPGGNFPA